jgi:hypothetical protein
MPKGRLEAFSDGVIAIIITIMVLEMKVPHGDRLQDLVPLLPVFLSLCPEFRLRGNLLEQPPPHAACLLCCDWRHALGHSAPVVLAIVVSVRHRMDGREPFHGRAYGALRRGALDARNRL